MIVAASDVGHANQPVIVSSSRTELDTHANMIIVGKHSFVIAWAGRNATVNPFTPDYEALTEVPIVDAAIMYECPYSGKEHILLVRNVLYVPAMDNNLIPPFVMREAGLIVNDTPQIHLRKPTVNDHAILFKDSYMKIPLSLWGIFSYFPTRAPTNDQLDACDDVYLLTPNGVWNPHSDAYSRNEENMLDWEGNMVEKQYRKQILLSEVESDTTMAAAATISKVESQAVDRLIPDATMTFVAPRLGTEVSPLYDPDRLCSLLCERAQESHFMMSVGSTNAWTSQHMINDNSDDNRDDDASQEDADDAAVRDLLATMDEPLGADIDLDEYMVSAARVTKNWSVQAEHLSKIWRIDLETAEKTLEITSQNCNRKQASELSRNYMQPTKKCYAIRELKNSSLWILSMLLVKQGSPRAVMLAANCL
jgi:hypothetical protein